MVVLLFAISLAVAVLGNIISRYYAGKIPAAVFPLFLYNAVGAAVAIAVFLVWGGVGRFSEFSVLLGIVFGLAVNIQAVATLIALRNGPMSFTVVIVSFSTVLTALSGALFWNEQLKITQIVGIALMALSFVFAVKSKRGENGASAKWLIFCAIAFVCCGSVGLMQKIHQTSVHKDEINAFLISANLTSAVVSVLLTLWFKKRESAVLPFRSYNRGALCMLFTVVAFGGGCVAVNHKLNLYLSGIVDSAVFFPVVNGGGLILATLAALIIYREKLTKRQWCGITVGILSVICLCL